MAVSAREVLREEAWKFLKIFYDLFYVREHMLFTCIFFSGNKRKAHVNLLEIVLHDGVEPSPGDLAFCWDTICLGHRTALGFQLLPGL